MVLPLPRVACALLLLFGWLTTLAAAEPAHDEASARGYLNCQLLSQPLVFVGETFPKLELTPPEAIAKHWGPYQLESTFYQEPGRQVFRASKAGPYAAWLRVYPDKHRPSTHLVTVYRLAESIPAETVFTRDNLKQLATAAALEPSVVEQQQALVLATLNQRPWSQCEFDSKVAELLAGLSLSKVSETAPRKNLDAMAMQRQWWLEIKRRHWKLDSEFSKVIAAPQPERGLNSPVIREGTLAEAGMKPGSDKNIDAVLSAWAADTDEAFAVCVVRNGVIVLHKAYGTRDGEPMTLTTPSWMASITKPMSATCLMMLVDQGLVDLDQPIDAYLPELRHIHVPKPLTARHLYTHTNGLDQWPGWSDEGPAVESRMADAYPFVQVGSDWAYNGLGYTLGGKIIENVSGEALPHFYVKHLLDPLEMAHTDVLGTHADARSVPLDIARIGQMLLNRGSYGNLRFMKAATFQKMLPQKLTATLGQETTKTFGIGLDGEPGSGQFGHGAASAATFHVNTKQKLVVVMTRNKIGTNYDKYHGQFIEAVQAGMVK